MGVSVREKVKGSGEYWCFVRYQGQRWSVNCGSEDDANDTAKDVRKEIRQGTFDIEAARSARVARAKVEEQNEVQSPLAPTLREFFNDRMLSAWEGSLGTSTYKSYEGSFRIHILPALGDASLPDITRHSIKALIADLRKKPVRSSKNPDASGKDESLPAMASEPARAQQKPMRLLSKETIRNILAALRSALSEAVEDGLIGSNPAVRLGKFYKECQNFHEEIDPFTAEEVSKLLLTTREVFGFEDYVIMLTLFHCGPRAGEVAGLAWPDLDARNRVLVIRRQRTRYAEKRKTKTSKKRSVDVSTVLLAELQALRKKRQAEYLERGKNEIPETMFLTHGVLLKDEKRTEGSPLDMGNWYKRVFWKACDKAGIRRRRLHDTRHTFASLLLGNGESLKYVSAQLGHASIRMTADVYGHLEIGANRAAMDRLPTLQSGQVRNASA
jgi:integrase